MTVSEVDDCDGVYVAHMGGIYHQSVSESSIFSLCRNVTTVTKTAWQLLQFANNFEEQSQGKMDYKVTTAVTGPLSKSIVQIAREYGDTLNCEIHGTIRDLHINDYSSYVMPSIRVSHGDQTAFVIREKFVEGLQALPLNRSLSEEHANQVVDCVIRDLVLRQKGVVSGDELIQLSIYYLSQMDFSIELGVNYQRLVDRQTSDLIHRGLQDLSAPEYAVFMRSFKWSL